MSPRRTASYEAEPSPVVAWRRSQLVGAGFAIDLADQLARDCGIDLHALLDLVDRGGAPGLAARILAPLGGEWPG